MLLLNYSHPLTDEQLAQITEIVGEVLEVRTIPAQIDRAIPLAEVAHELAENASLLPDEWQSRPLLINLPALAPVAAALLAEVHGRCGYFPSMLNIRPKAGSPTPVYEVGEVVGLQVIRDAARIYRSAGCTD